MLLFLFSIFSVSHQNSHILLGDSRQPIVGASSSSSSAAEEMSVPSPSTSASSNPSPSSIAPERWVRAEKATQGIISKVLPTPVSEERRREVIDYVQRLFRNYFGCEVFPYGSVPLKTYLPDGDIDLTAFVGASAEDTFANGMVSILEGEDQSRAAEFAVKDIQLIRAEVKLVKCIVQNIVVDISFNQIGGLCTLCLLERVDCLIGKEHLFKCSIILIKAWCYYESRILGAHHGLISTYALEILVLYVLHLFHSTLSGPLQVLYKFLDYFSKFDWENYCVSLSGPVRLSSLPDLVAEIPDNGGGSLLLSSDFLRYCTDMFSVPSRGADSNFRTFQPKHLNIVDPLKENNNLGRSVSKGNFFRIRSAFTYGARNLGQILLKPEDEIANGLCKFFFNTLDRHGNGQRPDIQVSRPIYRYSGYSPEETDSCALERVILESESDTNTSSHDGTNCQNASGLGSKCNSENEEDEGTMEGPPSELSFEAEHQKTKNAFDHRFFGDAKDFATYGVEGVEMPNDLPKYSELSGLNSMPPASAPYHAPHLYVSNSMLSDGKKTSGSSDLIPLQKFSKDHYAGVLCGSNGSMNGHGYEDLVVSRPNDATSKAVSNPENLHWTSATARSPDPSSPLSDLSGDYENQLRYLQYGRWCYDYVSNTQTLPRHPPPPSVFYGENLREAIQHSSWFKQNGFTHKVGNGVMPNTAFYAVNPYIIPAKPFVLEDTPKPRGTGTYFPNMNHLPQSHRLSAVKGRNHATVRSPRHIGRNPMFVETNRVDQTSRDLSNAAVSLDQSCSDVGSSNVHHLYTAQENGHPNGNGLVWQPEGGFELGSVENVGVAVETNPEGGRHRQQRCLSSPGKASPGSLRPSRGLKMPKPVFRDDDRYEKSRA